jgi:hypothetical protein
MRFPLLAVPPLSATALINQCLNISGCQQSVFDIMKRECNFCWHRLCVSDIVRFKNKRTFLSQFYIQCCQLNSDGFESACIVMSLIVTLVTPHTKVDLGHEESARLFFNNTFLFIC